MCFRVIFKTSLHMLILVYQAVFTSQCSVIYRSVFQSHVQRKLTVMEFVGQSISVLHNGKKCVGVLEEICLERQEIRLKTTTGQLVLNAAEIEDLQVLDVIERYCINVLE